MEGRGGASTDKGKSRLDTGGGSRNLGMGRMLIHGRARFSRYVVWVSLSATVKSEIGGVQIGLRGILRCLQLGSHFRAMLRSSRCPLCTDCLKLVPGKFNGLQVQV